VRGDLDGFIGIGLDNVVQLVIAIGLCSGALSFPKSLVFNTILPGIALSYVAGNFLYAWLARQLARREGREDVCAIPYGIYTPMMVAYSLLVMLPARNLALAQGDPDPSRTAWKVGLAACFISGVIEFSFSFLAGAIRRVTPSVSMLTHPLVGLISFMALLVMFFGRFSFPGGLTAVVVSTGLGAVLCWGTGLAPIGPCPVEQLGLHLPSISVLDLGMLFSPKALLPYVSIIFPLSLMSAISALQNLESISAAGDVYPARSVMMINGLGTLVGACLGSPFPLTIYVGHPCWKRLGARSSYSVMNGVFIAALCLSGSTALVAWLIPEYAGLPLVIWAGLIVTLQAYETIPARYWIAIVVGLLPCLGAWIAMVVKAVAAAVAGPGQEATVFSMATLAKWHELNLFADGSFALEQGFVFIAMVWASMLYYVVDRRFHLAAAWSGLGAGLSLLGLMHTWKFTSTGTMMNTPLLDWMKGDAIAPTREGLFPGWPYAAAYGFIACLLLAAQRWGKPVADESLTH
jgi:AGZA family xanthine/uracil permease-like MFS transporter